MNTKEFSDVLTNAMTLSMGQQLQLRKLEVGLSEANVTKEELIKLLLTSQKELMCKNNMLSQLLIKHI
jgi:hypothetical protein